MNDRNRTVVVGVDGSGASMAAVTWAAKLASSRTRSSLSSTNPLTPAIASGVPASASPCTPATRSSPATSALS